MINLISNSQEEWVRILGKGMVTIPKSWRDELGLTEGEVVKAKKVGNKAISLRPNLFISRIFSCQSESGVVVKPNSIFLDIIFKSKFG